MRAVQLGSVLAGHRLDSVAGKGGMGVVYLATHLTLERQVALKVVNPALAGDETFAERFKRESRIAASLRHPHIVTVHDAGEADGLLYITMEYVEGSDLRLMLDELGPLMPPVAARVVAQAASALDAAHERGLVHRDVKPANLLVQGAGEHLHVYLTDFGLTRHTSSVGGLTRTGHWVGTIDYVAPEQVEGGEVDGRADVYSLACVTYEILTGEVPFPQDNELAKLWARLRGEPPRLTELRPDLPRKLEGALQRGMAREPADRFATAGEFAEAAIAGLDAVSRGGPDEKTVAPPRRAEESDAAAEVRKRVTFLFTDVQGSTSLDGSSDPETMRTVMSRYFDAMHPVIERHGGMVAKRVGDALMAVFGIPVLREDDALRAARAALEMRSELECLNDDLEQRFGIRLVTRTGINTGRVVASDPSPGEAFATGEAVSLATRLEQAASDGEILIGSDTYDLVRDAVSVEMVESLDLKGTSAAYRLLAVRTGAQALAHQHDRALVGRAAELAELEDCLTNAVAEKQIRLAVVVGEAGAGKSRLVAELISRAGLRSLTGRCLDYGEGTTYWPVAELVRAAAGIEGADSSDVALAKIQALFPSEDAPALADAIGVAIGLADAERSTDQIFLAVRGLLDALTRDEPMILVLEDLHWADPALLDLVDYLTRIGRGIPMMVVALGRPDLMEARPGWSTNVPSLRLAPLGARDCASLVAGVLGGPLEPSLLRRLTDAAQGNPLFLEELVRTLSERGALERREGGWVARRAVAELETPATIEALLGARLEGLDPSERSVAEAASVVGQVFWPAPVAELRARRDVDRELNALLDREIVLTDDERMGGETGYRFAHILVRDAAYQRLLKETRATYHERFGLWLERVAGDRLGEYEEIIGYHLERAYQYRTELGPVDEELRALGVRAAARLGAAGQRAYEREDLVGSTALLERAVSLLDVDDPQRRNLVLGLGMSLIEAGSFEKADHVLTELTEAAQQSGDRYLDLRARIEQAFVRSLTHPDQGQSAALIALAAESVRASEAEGDAVGLVRALLLGAQMDVDAIRYADAEQKLRRALDCASRLGALRHENEILVWLGTVLYYGPAPTSVAIRELEDYLAARPSAAGAAPTGALLFLSALYAMRGDFARARAGFAEGRRQIEESGLGIFGAALTQLEGMVELKAGDPARAEAILREGHASLSAMGERVYLATVAHLLAEALCARGSWDEAERFSVEAEELGSAEDLDVQMGWRRTRALVLAYRGDLSVARRMAAEAVELARTTESPLRLADALRVLADVLESAGSGDEAKPVLREALSLYEAKEDEVSARRIRARLTDG